jgi:hypothetical protein
VQDNANAYAPQVANDFSSANSDISGAATPFDRNTFNQFLSPYTDNVVNRIAQLGERNLSENLLPAVNDTFIRAGQFGGSRNADFTERALRDTDESILGQQATALESAQNNAMSNYNTAEGRSLQAGNSLGALGQLTGQENRNELNFTNTIGGQQQQQNQNNLNVAEQDFQNQKNYPLAQLGIVNAAIRGYQPPTSTTSYTGSQLNPANTSASPLTLAGGVAQSYSGY